MARQTSIEAYRQIESEGLLKKLKLEVYKIIFENGPITGSELFTIAKKNHGDTSLRDIYQPRLGELRSLGVVQEVGKKFCSISGRKVLLWDVTKKVPKKEKKTLTMEIAELDRQIKKLREKRKMLFAKLQRTFDF